MKDKNLHGTIQQPLDDEKIDVFMHVTNFISNLLQVSTEKLLVHDSSGREIESQLLPISNATLQLRDKYVKAYLSKFPSDALKYWLAFSTSLPPLGFNTYIVSSAKQIGWQYCFFLNNVSMWNEWIGSIASKLLTKCSILLLLFIEGPSSTISLVHTSEESTNKTIEVGQGSLKLLYSADEGKLTHYVNSRSLVYFFCWRFSSEWTILFN